jgi:hypothetical protein
MKSTPTLGVLRAIMLQSHIVCVMLRDFLGEGVGSSPHRPPHQVGKDWGMVMAKSEQLCGCCPSKHLPCGRILARGISSMTQVATLECRRFREYTGAAYLFDCDVAQFLHSGGSSCAQQRPHVVG